MNEASTTTQGSNWTNTLFTWIQVVGFIYLLLIGVNLIGDGFKWVSGGTEGAKAIFAFASNPISGVILGTLATALVQSSSTVTSVIVGLVAGGVPVEIAVPMIMGANMGTTITNTIVSLGAIGESKTFNKSFQAATVHDFFNLYSILIFLPIEMVFHPLEKMGGYIASRAFDGTSASMSDLNVIGAITKPVSKGIVSGLKVFPESIGGYITIILGIALVIGSVILLGKVLKAVMTGKAKHLVEKAVGGNTATGIASGTIVTMLVQSSSTTTSLIVPLAGAGVLTTRQVFPFTMGANIGTCITALLAATAVDGPFREFALQIALVHLLYNVCGVIIFSLVPWVKDLPIHSAKLLGTKASEHRAWAFGYIFTVFFILPGGVFAGQTLGHDKKPPLHQEVQAVDKDAKEINLHIE